ncbi:hypothetical protein ABT099_23430 [Streptomyces prasinus]|uniref:hypothetical protein n=1 Tax=Streptomyces prasinus TaxID=67345 RepID=UPI0033219847
MTDPTMTTAKRLLVTVHRNATPWRNDTEPRLIADLTVKDHDNQTIRSTRLLGSDDTGAGKCIGWQALDEVAVASLLEILDSEPTVTVSRGIGGQVEVVLNASGRGCQLMGDIHPLHHCDLTARGRLDAERAVSVRRFLHELPASLPERPEPFFRPGRTYISTGQQRVWNGITYALCNPQPARVFRCDSVTADPDGNQVAFGFFEGAATKPWHPDGLDLAAWDRGWKLTNVATADEG